MKARAAHITAKLALFALLLFASAGLYLGQVWFAIYIARRLGWLP